MKKILLVTGASSDVGQAYIRAYAGRYDKIVGTYRTPRESLETLADELAGKLELYQLDMLHEAEIDDFCAWMKEKELLPRYVLHLPAQKSEMSRAHELDSGRLRSELEVSVVSFMRLMRPVLEAMSKEQFGRICCMLSSVTENAIAFQCAYMISKYALMGAVKALAVEYAGKHVTVNAVSPSMIETRFIDSTPDYAKKKMMMMIPIKRFAVPEDVTRAMAFLLEDENEYVTGENLLIAGGGIIK